MTNMFILLMIHIFQLPTYYKNKTVSHWGHRTLAHFFSKFNFINLYHYSKMSQKSTSPMINSLNLQIFYFKSALTSPSLLVHPFFGQSYSLSNIDFIIPLSNIVEKIFFNTIKIIGPISIPKIPINLNPVYIAIKVNIG